MTSAWTRTFDASSAEIRFQPTTFRPTLRGLHALDLGDPRPGRVQPAALVGVLVAVEVALAIDLEAVLVVAPLVDLLSPLVSRNLRSSLPWPSRRA